MFFLPEFETGHLLEVLQPGVDCVEDVEGVSLPHTVRDVDVENTQLKPARLRGHRVTGAMFYWRIFPFSEVSIIFHYETFLNNLNSFLCRWEDIETDLKRVQSESWVEVIWHDMTWSPFYFPVGGGEDISMQRKVKCREWNVKFHLCFDVANKN